MPENLGGILRTYALGMVLGISYATTPDSIITKPFVLEIVAEPPRGVCADRGYISNNIRVGMFNGVHNACFEDLMRTSDGWSVTVIRNNIDPLNIIVSKNSPDAR